MNKNIFGIVILCLSTLAACSPGMSIAPNAPAPAPRAFADGGVDGGGGKGVLCGSRLYTLDLYEARSSGIIPQAKGHSTEENIRNYAVRFAEYFSEDRQSTLIPDLPDLALREMSVNIISRFRDIPKGERLPLTNDATVPPLLNGCKVVQIAIYANDGTIYRDREYWNMLAPLEKAALIYHEWIYHRARTYGAVNSDETRKVLGRIFSGEDLDGILSPIWDAEEKKWCGGGIEGSPSQEVYEYFITDEIRDGTAGLAIYFRAFKGVYVTSRTWAFIPGLTMKRFVAKEFGAVHTKVYNSLLKKEWVLELVKNSRRGNIELRAYSAPDTVIPDFSYSFCSNDDLTPEVEVQ